MTPETPPTFHATFPSPTTPLQSRPHPQHDNLSPSTNTSQLPHSPCRITKTTSSSHALAIFNARSITLDLVHPHAANNFDSVPSSSTWSLVFIQSIGSGANGKVYLAVSPGQKVAVKILNNNHSIDVFGEVALHRSLNHHNIIQFINAGMVDGSMVLVTDFAENGSLHHVIAKDRRSNSPILTGPTMSRIAGEIANALTFLHSKDILHRDIKSANVLLTKHFEVKLCDLGLAVHMADRDSRGNPIHRENNVVGTFRWLPPEVLSGSPTYSCASDIYGLGMVLWEMAANCTAPYGSHRDNTAVAKFVLGGGREAIPPGTPDDYKQLIQRCWSQDPTKRPKAEEMVHIKMECYESLVTDGESLIGPSSETGPSSALDDNGYKHLAAEFGASNDSGSMVVVNHMTTMDHASFTSVMIPSQTTAEYDGSLEECADMLIVRRDESIPPAESSSQTNPASLPVSEVGKSDTAHNTRRWLSAKVSTYLPRLSKSAQQPGAPSLHNVEDE